MKDCRKRSCLNYKGLPGSIADDNCKTCSQSYPDKFINQRMLDKKLKKVKK